MVEDRDRLRAKVNDVEIVELLIHWVDDEFVLDDDQARKVRQAVLHLGCVIVVSFHDDLVDLHFRYSLEGEDRAEVVQRVVQQLYG